MIGIGLIDLLVRLGAVVTLAVMMSLDGDVTRRHITPLEPPHTSSTPHNL